MYKSSMNNSYVNKTQRRKRVTKVTKFSSSSLKDMYIYMDNSIENMHTDVGALRVNKRKKTTNRLTHQICTYISLVASHEMGVFIGFVLFICRRRRETLY